VATPPRLPSTPAKLTHAAHHLVRPLPTPSISAVQGLRPTARQQPWNSPAASLSAVPISTAFFNRNPVNNYMCNLAAAADAPFHYRVVFFISSWHVYGIVHTASGRVLFEASSRELQVANSVYKTSTVSTAFNVGIILGQRMRESGIFSARIDPRSYKARVKALAMMEALRLCGIRVAVPRLTDRERFTLANVLASVASLHPRTTLEHLPPLQDLVQRDHAVEAALAAEAAAASAAAPSPTKAAAAATKGAKAAKASKSKTETPAASS
jgi:ribosomal protein L18